ncbi:PQQ-binding-like beta-propeller repeat protein [Streptomyces sp. MS06]|uniref:outer membrane protein assembly factor BamB family protein n=1 Tax=Streptomyces sp. MS06 TaxID=3385974 RepID=UPI0039A0A78F
MTQPPPPPPNQPPQQGGFGPPEQQPSAPSPAQQPGPYSTPQPAQQPQAGYGYPGRPPGPGYPGQPSGYGYPGQPSGPGYGYPQPGRPPRPQSGTPDRGGRRINAQAAIIIAAVVAIALIVVGGVWYAHSSAGGGKDDTAGSSGGTGGGGDGKDDGGTQGSEKVPSDTSARMFLEIPAPAVKDRQVDSVEGSWLTGRVYAKSGVDEIVGYDSGSGAEKWTLPLSGQTCAGSDQVTSDGIAVVLAEQAERNGEGEHEPCTEITAFDVNTGRKLWTRSVTGSGNKLAFGEVSISGTTVAVGGGLDGGAAFDLTSGKSLWQPEPGRCEDAGYAGGAQLVAVRRCGGYDGRYEIQLLNAETGAVRWKYRLPAGIDNAKVISTDPVVVGVDSADVTSSGATDIFSLDDRGKLLYKIGLEDGRYAHRCEIAQYDGCRGVVVGNGSLYVPTSEHDGSGDGGRTNEIVAFSLTTGKTTGVRIDAGDDWTIFPVRMDGGNVIAYKEAPYGKGDRIVSADGATGEETTLLELPADESVQDAVSAIGPDRAQLWYAGGRLFMSQDLVSKPYSADEKEYTALGFGAE